MYVCYSYLSRFVSAMHSMSLSQFIPHFLPPRLWIPFFLFFHSSWFVKHFSNLYILRSLAVVYQRTRWRDDAFVERWWLWIPLFLSTFYSCLLLQFQNRYHMLIIIISINLWERKSRKKLKGWLILLAFSKRWKNLLHKEIHYR